MSYKGQIKKIDAREHIRLRPSMYIGSVDKVGMHYLIIELLRFLSEESKDKPILILDLSNEITVLRFKGTIINEKIHSDPEKTLNALTGVGSITLSGCSTILVTALFNLASYVKVSSNKGDHLVLNNGKFDVNPANIAKEDWLSFQFKMDSEFFGKHTFSKAILRNECEELAALSNNVQIELVDNRNGCNYQEKFTMEGGLLQLFNNKLDQLNADNYNSYPRSADTPHFHIKVKEPDLSLELVFMISNQENTFEKVYYKFLNLTDGGSHISYLKMRLKKLNNRLNKKFDAYENDLDSFNLMTNIETKHPFPFAGPTRARIEDPALVQIMKSAFEKLEAEIISYYQQ